jgi:hypothetical protein
MSTSPSISTGPFVVGEKPAPLLYGFQDSNGAVIDLTGYTAKFVYREQDGTPTTANATLPTPANGQAQYSWTGVEFPTPGHYLAEFIVGNGTQRFNSILITFDVRAPVGLEPNI